MNAGEMISF